MIDKLLKRKKVFNETLLDFTSSLCMSGRVYTRVYSRKANITIDNPCVCKWSLDILFYDVENSLLYRACVQRCKCHVNTE